ncbi:MAG: glycyl-radical enzyme activating protein [Promethearchaeota archaeon]|nr:MAG: glycyl-radical enzyme activating protein [Candidatus Lokiarchaeota archaeon]
MKTLIVNVKRNSLDDGPGIRTVIFFKGCPLSCVWCQNPEAKSPSQEISFNKENCISCKKCFEACEIGAIDFSYKYRIHRDKCNLCGNCIDTCEYDALEFTGKVYDIEILTKLILKDKRFYENSGGGVTLSGGEPTLHITYVNELLKELKKDNIHICLETCGYYNREKFNNLILPYLDLIYFDLKIYDSDLFKKYCKISNKVIFQNFENLIQDKKVEVLPRIPLIPKITATKDNLTVLANYLKCNKIKKIGFLPYNPLWLSKTEYIGIKANYTHSNWLSQNEKKKIKEIFSDFEFRDF